MNNILLKEEGKEAMTFQINAFLTVNPHEVITASLVLTNKNILNNLIRDSDQSCASYNYMMILWKEDYTRHNVREVLTNNFATRMTYQPIEKISPSNAQYADIWVKNAFNIGDDYFANMVTKGDLFKI
ncbi:hypothetical protein Glove_130g192 [Diversispora epigaea]|uniref:Uncharacterized protein n=1 Tax=Diversispora epigaea TaxID=1348612 RepID=A0A397J4R1_9GLOM|nr:hypothetical protein Glove_130g192 [Diversispora epigaea]